VVEVSNGEFNEWLRLAIAGLAVIAWYLFRRAVAQLDEDQKETAREVTKLRDLVMQLLTRDRLRRLADYERDERDQ
jgi:hypothetical protein